MTETNPYKAYTDDSILNSDPVGLVVALYEGAIDSCVAARGCLANRDIPGRTKAINKIGSIVTELIRTLDHKKGGEISQNLRRLYAYIQGRVTDAHIRQNAAPLEEVEKLLSTMLEGWMHAKVKCNPVPSFGNTSLVVPASHPAHSQEDYSYAAAGAPYGSYLSEAGDFASAAYSF